MIGYGMVILLKFSCNTTHTEYLYLYMFGSKKTNSRYISQITLKWTTKKTRGLLLSIILVIRILIMVFYDW